MLTTGRYNIQMGIFYNQRELATPYLHEPKIDLNVVK
jgi:hypothetical protein